MRFTIGRTLSLGLRVCYAIRWHALLVLVPTSIAIAALSAWMMPYAAESAPSTWAKMANIWINTVISSPATLAVSFVCLRFTQGEDAAIASIRSAPWGRLPAVLAAFLILQSVTFWPSALLDWSERGTFGIGNYLIYTANVLVFDTLTFVFTPALLEERLSPWQAMRRSFDLIRRHPWRILVTDVILWGVMLVLNQIAIYLYYAFGWSDIYWHIWSVIWISLATWLGTTTIVAAYRLLRLEREGPTRLALAAVFD